MKTFLALLASHRFLSSSLSGTSLLIFSAASSSAQQGQYQQQPSYPYQSQQPYQQQQQPYPYQYQQQPPQSQQAPPQHQQAKQPAPAPEDPSAVKGDSALARGYSRVAEKYFSDAIDKNPKKSDYYAARGTAYLDFDEDKAIADITLALSLPHEKEEAYNDNCSLAVAYGYKGNFDQEIVYDNQAIGIDPKLSGAYTDLARAYFMKGDFDQALANVDKAIKIEPSFYLDYQYKAAIYEAKGDHAHATADYNKALELIRKTEAMVDNYSLVNTEAWILATCPESSIRDGGQAAKVASRAGKMCEWKQWDAWEAYAAACAENGDFNKAVEYQTKALNSPELPADCAQRVKDNLALYQAHQPYHDLKTFTLL